MFKKIKKFLGKETVLGNILGLVANKATQGIVFEDHTVKRLIDSVGEEKFW